MLSEILIELHPQQAGSLFEDTQMHSLVSSCRRGHGFKADERHFRSQGGKVQLFETDDLTLAIFHEDDIVTGFFTEVFLIGVSEPHRQRIPDWAEEQLYFRFHVSVLVLWREFHQGRFE